MSAFVIGEGRTYDMTERMVMSDGIAGGTATSVLAACIPNAIAVDRATEDEDRQGTDFWVTLASSHRLSVDLKARDIDPLERFGSDDLLIEWWSAVETGHIGWTVDPSKRTDYVLYWFEPTGRYALVPFPLLSAAAIAYGDQWRFTYGVTETKSSRGGRTWTTHWSPVSRKAIWRAIFDLSNGTVKP